MCRLFCVFKSPKGIQQYIGVDHMIQGGIYTSLEHATNRAFEIKQVDYQVWIEEYESSNGIIDVLTKNNVVETYAIDD